MKNFLLTFFILCASFTNGISQYTKYDNLPGIDKIYKPAYDNTFTGWQKMLYEYPVNFNSIEKKFNSYSVKNPNEKSAIIRYYKIWKRAVEPYANNSGEIILPDLKEISIKQYNTQLNLSKQTKSAAFTNSKWTFLGPKETFWKNEENLEPDRIDQSGNPKQCPWQVNVYALDVAKSNTNVIYCGTETGFVNKSTDKGLTWKQLGKNYPFGGGVSAVAVHPENEEIVYVSAGRQIHKTTNGGETWLPLISEEDKFGAVRLKINPENQNIIIAAASEGLFVSDDAGSSWKRKWSSTTWDCEFNPQNPSEIYGITKSLAGKFRIIISENDGESFSSDTNFPETYNETSGGLLAVTAANPNLLYVTMLASEGEEKVPFIMKGTKNGNAFNWVQTKKGEYQSTGGLGGFTNGQGYFDLILEVSPTNENLVFWGTCSLWKSSDGGTNFTKLGGYGGNFPIHPDIQDIKITDAGDTWVATDGGMNLSLDYFESLENYSSRTKGIIGSDMWGFDQGWNEDLIVGGRYHNGNTAIADFYDDKSLRLGGAESPTGWILQGKSRHAAFNDLGNGWILPKTAEDLAEGRFIFSKYPNMDEYGGRRSNLVHHPNYYGTLYLGEGNGFWKSTDMGESFDLLFQFPDKVRYLQISNKNPDVLYADIIGKGLYKSTDGGKSWVQKPNLTNGSYGNSNWNGKLFFTISPYDENKIYVCLQNGTWSADIGKVFKSEDGGDTWTDWTSGLNEYTKCLVIQPASDGKDLVYVFTTSINGNISKVFSRIEGQPYWNDFNTNYPAGMSVNLALPFYRDSKLRVAGNAGVWESPMLDTAFTPIVNPWVEKSVYNCMEDTLYFDDHSILNHAGASWNWQITPEPEFISNANIRNPKVVLGNPGSYNVVLSVTQNGQTYQKTINEMVTTTTCPSVNDCNNPAEIDKTNWQLMYTDSEEKFGEDGKAINAFDGNPDSFWHTEWYYSDPVQPHEIQIDLGKEYLLSSFSYLPRQSSSNGRIKDYEFYVSASNSNWGNPIKAGEFESDASPKKVSFEPVSGRYIKFKSLSEQNGNSFTTVAEFSLLGCIENNNTKVDEISTKEIEAFPIPAKDKITVQLPFYNSDEKWNYKILSSAGQVVQQNKFENKSSNCTFNLNGLKPGMYFILLQNEKLATFRIKFLKTN